MMAAFIRMLLLIAVTTLPLAGVTCLSLAFFMLPHPFFAVWGAMAAYVLAVRIIASGSTAQ